MIKKLLKFESNKEKYTFWSIVTVLVILMGITFYPVVKAQLSMMVMGEKTIEKSSQINLGPSKTPQEYYDMFQCSCCGKSIDANCCGSAKQRKAHLDQLLLEGPSENELVYLMVKKFGFDVLKDPSKEQEVKDYIKSIAPDNPPKIEIHNPQFNFGTISQADGVVSTTFTVKNAGGTDLIIDNMDSSCMCTTANLIYQGVEGPKFGMSMHGDNPTDYTLTLPPGDTAQLKVYYDPMAHGVQNKPEMSIVRYVTIISNDPVDFQKKVKIELTQLP